MAYGDLGTAANVVTEIINQVEIPADMTVNVSGQNEEMNISFRSLKFALLLAIFLVYLVMAAEFESFLHPFVVMFTIPLAFIGGIFALWFTHSQISVLVFLGGIILVGIVVNNAIVLIDFVNQNRARGMDKRTALLEAGRSRLRPILMTAGTTVLSLVPLCFTSVQIGGGGPPYYPMACVIVGGLAFSTLVTLVILPEIYIMLDDLNVWLCRLVSSAKTVPTPT